ncbi:histone H1B-like [Tyto alba]|uniref:histone H1B-like n=1 Tax=Tyto alba TaxID=56313 RepID=UPI001C6843D5|nr:histone H1B-like [Tyto alba]
MPRGRVAPQRGASRAAMPVAKKRGRLSLSDLILRAVCLSTARKGASLALIKKTLAAGGYDVVKNRGRLKAAVGALVSKELLQRVTGSGVAGSFRIGRVGKQRLEGAGRRGRAAREVRQHPAGKRKGPRRGVKATAQRLKKPRRRRGKAVKAAAVEEAAAGGAEEAGGPTAVAARGEF